MRESLLKILRCPCDFGALEIEGYVKEKDDHIVNGRLKCGKCNNFYFIREGVPELFPKASLHSRNDLLGKIQAETIDRFGFEWRYFRDWGWFTEYPDVPDAEKKFFGGLVKHTHSAFWKKSLFQKEELTPQHLVLDAGCGNGRFTAQAAETGAEVVGIDLGWGVRSAFEHTRSFNNVHIIRGDIFRLPFADKTFDRIFSIGVLQHTGNGRAAFGSLSRTLAPGGLIVAHVYGKGMKTYEILDTFIRSMTTRMAIETQMRLSRGAAAVARWLHRGYKWKESLYQGLCKHMILLPTEHHMYDWWSAPVAAHYSVDEILSWFSEEKVTIVRSNPPLGCRFSERMRRRSHGAISVLGKKA